VSSAFLKPRQVTVKRCADHVIIDCDVDGEHTAIVWQQLNDDISRNTIGEPYVGTPAMPSWIRTWVVSVGDDVAGL